ncbi:MAG: alpha-2-macroglobulin, partial [Thermoanaerobaculia bacterium]
PVQVHGQERQVAVSRALAPGSDAVAFDLAVPAERRADETRLTVRFSPSLALAMVDALPYLADYPYGCTEQTLSRFLPAVVVAHTLRSLGLAPEAVVEKLFGGIEPEHAAKTQRGGKRDLHRLDEMAQAGLDRLYDFQRPDGGWGWWKQAESDHFMTAYVVWGLVLAQGADLDVRPEVVERGAEFLRKEIVEEEDHPDLQAWMLHALAVHHAHARRGEVSTFEATALANLWKGRDDLNAYTRALFALAAHHYGDAEKARSLVRNLENGVKRDDAPDDSVVLQGPRGSQPEVLGTAHWGEDGLWWRWSEGGVEASAFALRALAAIEPGSRLVEPVANWLVKN